ncbi:MAG: response regulator [Anaerolineaceae bacterium]|nr:response regulator [Anaerolineaceae bacterium]
MQAQNTILIVDDNPVGLQHLAMILQSPGHELILSSSGGEALEKVKSIQPDLILLDVLMPGMDGFEVCRRLRSDPVLAEVPILIITALDDRESRLKGLNAGADDFITKPIDPDELEARVHTILRLNRYRRLLEKQSELEEANRALRQAYDTTLEGWGRVLDLRDGETEGHSKRVAVMTVRLALELGIEGEALLHIRRGALLHDIGKIAIPDRILLKPGELTIDEWEPMRRHPVYAYETLSSIPYLRPALDIPYCHHERWDGSGYPQGLKDKQIPLAARIFAVVDVWDALTSDRPYRKAWPKDKVIEYIHAQSGKLFDPRVVDMFFYLKDLGEL